MNHSTETPVSTEHQAIVAERSFGDRQIFNATEQLKQRLADHAEHLERVVCEAIERALPFGSTGMDANLREAVRTAVGRTSQLDQRVAMSMDRLDALANRFQVMINKLDEEGGFAKARLAGKKAAVTRKRRK